MATIRLSKQSKTIKVVSRKENIRLEKDQGKITLQHTGRRGPQGIQGEQGDSGSDATDKNFLYAFTNQSGLTVAHNLGKYPAVTITDSAGDEVEADVEHISINQLALSFSNSFSGRIICN